MGLMDRMMDRMIRNMSVQEKEEMMLKMMPLMMKDVDMLKMMPGMMSSMGRFLNVTGIVTFIRQAPGHEHIDVRHDGLHGREGHACDDANDE